MERHRRTFYQLDCIHQSERSSSDQSDATENVDVSVCARLSEAAGKSYYASIRHKGFVDHGMSRTAG